MISKTINNQDGLVTYEFSGRHIYSLIHYLSLTTKDLDIIKQLIIYYDNDKFREKCIEMLSQHKNIHLIVNSIDAMYNGKSVFVEDKITHVNKHKWFEYLYINQEGNQINPPVSVFEPCSQKLETKELCGHL